MNGDVYSLHKYVNIVDDVKIRSGWSGHITRMVHVTKEYTDRQFKT